MLPNANPDEKWLEWIPQNEVGHLMFITQLYTLHHAILYLVYLGEFTGHENLQKSGEIRVRDSCARKLWIQGLAPKYSD